jgi:hypothetical protein
MLPSDAYFTNGSEKMVCNLSLFYSEADAVLLYLWRRFNDLKVGAIYTVLWIPLVTADMLLVCCE